MEEAMICKVCAETFSDEKGRIPRILTACGHSFCETCLKKLESRTAQEFTTTRRIFVQYTITCPKCKRRTTTKGPSSHYLPKNYSYLDLITEIATFNEDRDSLEYCQVHPNYILDMFCHDEEEVVCMNCTTYGKHKRHKVSKLSWFADQQADSIQHKIDCIYDVINHYKDLKSDLGSREHNLKRKFKYIQNSITSRFSQIKSEINSILDAKQESVLSQLDMCSSSQLSLLEMQKEAASNFIDKLDEKKDYAENFLADFDESSIAKEKNLQHDMRQCLNEAESHEMLTNDMFEVRMDKSDHIVENVNEMVDAWVCSIEETKQDPLLEPISTIWEKRIPSFGDSMNSMFGEASEVVAHNPFEGIDCKFLCDGKLQHCSATNYDEEINCDGETSCDDEIEDTVQQSDEEISSDSVAELGDVDTE